MRGVPRHLVVDRSGPDGAVARVTLARPEVHNAFNAELIGELRDTFESLAGEPAERLRAVVLAGASRSFSAGADVDWMRRSLSLSRDENEADADRMAAMFTAIDTCPAPVIARVQGAALGGGAALCAVSDVVIAEAGAVFGFTEVRLGILPAVVSPLVVAKIGETHARALFVGGERFDAERALRIGLVHQLASGEEELDAAVERAVDAVLSGGPNAVRAAKRVIRDLRGLTPDETRRMTVERIAAQRTSAEGQDGLAAFLDRRPPAWASPGDDAPGG